MPTKEYRFLGQVYDALKRDSNGFTRDGCVAIADPQSGRPKVEAREVVKWVPYSHNTQSYLQHRLRREFPGAQGIIINQLMEDIIAYHIPTAEEQNKLRQLRI